MRNRIGTRTRRIRSRGSIFRERRRIVLNILRDPLGRVLDVGARPGVFTEPMVRRNAVCVRTAGFDLACTTVWGRNGRSADPLELRRLRVSWCDSPREVSKSLAGCYEWYRVVQRLQSRGVMATVTNALY